MTAGVAVARYDSTDGYPEHPRETAYHAAQLATLSVDGKVTTVKRQANQVEAAGGDQTPIAAEQAAAAAPTVDDWWRQYSSWSKLQDNLNGHPTGPFSRDDPTQAAIYDWFENGTGNHGDGDLDGLASEG